LAKRKAEEEARFLAKDPKELGAGAQTVYRDKHGRRLEALEEIMRVESGQPKRPEETMEWGKGAVQRKEKEDVQRRLEEEKTAPFARYSNDQTLNEKQREELRWEDPMAAFITQRRQEEVVEEEQRIKKEKKKEKKERKRLLIEQGIDPEQLKKEKRERKDKKAAEKKEKKKKDKKEQPASTQAYRGAWPSNRFNIPPGPEWDGIDRSNGFEIRFISAQSEKVARADAAYKWSVEDM